MSSRGNTYLKYSGMAIQMFVLLLISIFTGQKIDAYFELSKPFFTITLALIALIAYLVKLYLDVINGRI